MNRRILKIEKGSRGNEEIYEMKIINRRKEERDMKRKEKINLSWKLKESICWISQKSHAKNKIEMRDWRDDIEKIVIASL